MRRLKDNRGILSVDFLFAMTMAAVLCMMMFAFTTTLAMIEITQYVAFSTARAHAAAHEDQDRQMALGQAKFNSFNNSKLFPALSPLLGNGWFEIDPKSLDIRGGGRGGATFDEDYGQGAQDALPHEGVRFRFHAKILKMNLPFMGAITDEEDFGTWVTGFIFREPSAEECRKTMEVGIRYQAIKKLDRMNRFERAVSIPYSKGDQAYFPMEDNGC
ncbi:MAG: hypothetical protein KF802_08775 [Bdellovibrionaceae bacterium]|nr:hypothetical protein [Pseudobdellovibrionaceae bacterium]